jgi:hypothetical protein
MRKTLEAIPGSHHRGSDNRFKPEMLVRGIPKRTEPKVILAKAKQITCSQCIFSHDYSPSGPCGGFTRASVTRTVGETQDIKLTAGDGYVMNERFATWAQGPGKNARKLCATNKTIDI